ncbi:Helicase domino [Bienertia sinuspersici]
MDKDFESLVQSDAFTSLTEPSKMNALKSLDAPDTYDKLKERQDRMRAADDASDEDDDDVEDDDKPSADKRSHISGDDRGDSFIVEDKSLKKKGWVDEILERNNAEDTEDEDSGCSNELEDSESDEGGTEDEEDDERAETLKDWEQSDDDVGTNWINEENSNGEQNAV